MSSDDLVAAPEQARLLALDPSESVEQMAKGRIEVGRAALAAALAGSLPGVGGALERIAREAEARNASGQSAVDWSWFAETARAALAAKPEPGQQWVRAEDFAVVVEQRDRAEMMLANESLAAKPEPGLDARDVYEAWALAMCRQGRVLAPERRTWDLLPQQEKNLDADIAYQLNRVGPARLSDEGAEG